MKVLTYINEIYSKTEVELTYKNIEEYPVEIIVEIPLKIEIIFNYFIAKINDKVIKSKILKSDKADEKYSDAIASGDTGITSSYDTSKKICSLKIGNLPKDETLKLKFSFLHLVKIKDSFYCINLIKDFPSISNFNTNSFEGKVIIETYSSINNLILMNDSNNKVSLMPLYSKGNKKCEIKYEHKSFLEKIMFKTIKMEQSLLISQYNNKMDETNYILKYYYNTDINNDIKYPCLFIFIIDQSGSMEDSIKNVIITLNKLMESLPKNSYYQLIGFGSNYIIYNKTPEKNNKKNLKKAKKIINSLAADLGGTDLSFPLNYILKDCYADYKDINLAKQIIVLTDGDINIGDDIIELIKFHNNEFRIHFVGIGDEVNKKLIIDASNSGNGTYHFIENSSDELDEKVFDVINICTKEYINNHKFILNDKVFELNPINKTTYNKESFHYCFIQKGKEKFNDINLIFNWENLKEKFSKNIEFKSDDIVKLPEGEEFSKLIIGLALNYDNINNKEEKIKLSESYQVLCDFTSLFAQIEGEKKTENKMVTFIKEYSIPKVKKKKFRDFPMENFKFMTVKKGLVLEDFRKDYQSKFCKFDYINDDFDRIEENKKNNFTKIILVIGLIIIIILIYYFINKLI